MGSVHTITFGSVALAVNAVSIGVSCGLAAEPKLRNALEALPRTHASASERRRPKAGNAAVVLRIPSTSHAP